MMGSADHLATLRGLTGVSRMPDGDRGQHCIPWAHSAMGDNMVLGRAYVGSEAVFGQLMGRVDGRQGGDRQ